MGSNGKDRLLSLPTEVRYKIYGYLFCRYEGPIWLVSHYQLFQPLYSVPATQSDPIFETQLFRCSWDSYKDAVSFAYRNNNFELRGDLTAFCGLGLPALSSIRTLSVVQGPWKPGVQEDRAWGLIQQHCIGLDNLELVLQQDSLLACVPFLDDFHGMTPKLRKGVLALDVCVWDKAFAFDAQYRELAWSEDVIHQSVERAEASLLAQKRVIGLPRRAQHIVLTADMTAGAVQALDAYFASLDKHLFAKTRREPPTHGPRAVGGRSTRYWYESR